MLVSHLSDETTAKRVEERFTEFGDVDEVELFRHPITQRSLGLASVVFKSRKSMRKAVDQMDGQRFMAAYVSVEQDCDGS